MLVTPSARAGQICDDVGVCVSADQPFSRIIPLYGAFNEMLLALNARDSIAARTTADEDMDSLRELPAIGTHMRPNAELILSLHPDLVLQMAGRQEASLQTDNLRSFGLSVLTFDITTFQQLFSLMEKLGQLTGNQKNAAELVAQWQKRLKGLSSTSVYKPLVYYEVRQPQLLTVGAKSMVNDIITAAGGVNVVNVPKKLARYNEEALLLAQPEICILQKGPMNPNPVPLTSRPNLKNLPCVKNKMVFIVSEREFSRPGPNSITAAEKLADMVKKVRRNH